MKPLLLIPSFVLLVMSMVAVVIWWQQPHLSYSHDLVQVLAPEGDWVLASSSNAGVAYVRRDGGASGKAYAAMFTLPADHGADALMAYVKQEARDDAQARRLEVVDSRFEYSVARGYPCVLHRQTVRAPHGGGLRQEQTLSCRHPGKGSVGVALGFSKEGARPDRAFERHAQAFFDNVTIRGDAGGGGQSPVALAR